MDEIVIVGNGPAGVSAAIYAVRAGIKATVIGKGGGALAKAEKIENYYGFENPITGEQLINNGIAQAKRLGVALVSDEVVGIGYEYEDADAEKFVVRTVNGEYKADSVILATGAGRVAPKIKGIDTFEGKGISYCAVCDAFFHRGKDVAVLGCGEYALTETLELLNVVKTVTVLCNGEMPVSKISEAAKNPETAHKIKIIASPIDEFSGTAAIESILFSDGTRIAVSGVFVAVGVAGVSDLAKKIGAETNGSKILTDENMATNIPGLYAAGDCTGGMLQIAKAVYEGAKAGTEAAKYLRKKHGDKNI